MFLPPYMHLRFNPDLDKDRPWRTIGVHFYEHDQLKLRVSIPSDFPTDLASIPRFLHYLFDPKGRHQRACLFHDWLYTSKECSRLMADVVLAVIMKSDGVWLWRRALIYLGVRLFGWMVWRKK